MSRCIASRPMLSIFSTLQLDQTAQISSTEPSPRLLLLSLTTVLGLTWASHEQYAGVIAIRSASGVYLGTLLFGPSFSLNFFITVEKLSFGFSLDCTQLKFCVSRAFCGSYGGEKTKGNNNAASPFQFSLLLFLFFICM